jgi:hypothetical protein
MIAEMQGCRVPEWRHSQQGTALRLFFTCWIVYALHFATNTVREIYPALALGDHLSFDVSEYNNLHPDIFEIPGRGVFINNNPGASILGAIPYLAARPLIDRVVEGVRRARSISPDSVPKYNTPFPLVREFYRKATERGLDVKFGLAAATVQGLLMAPLSALSAVMMFYILLNLTRSIPSALLLALLYAFATPVFFRTGQLNQNLLVSHFGFFSFALLWRPWAGASLLQKRHYLLAGLLAGWAVVLDYSGLVVVLALALYAFVFQNGRSFDQRSMANVLSYGTGVSCAVAVLLAYQWLSFGHPLYPAQTYMPPANYSDLGYRGMDWPKLDLLWDTGFSIHFGLFSSAPILLLSLYVPGWFRGQRVIDLPELYFVVVFSLLLFLFCAANQYGRMQFNSGVRHVVPVTPFLFLLVAGVMIRMPALVSAIVGTLGAYWSWCLAMYRDVEHGLGVLEPFVQVTFGGFRLPWVTTLKNMGYFGEGGSVIPLLLLMGGLLWIIWSVPLTRFQQGNFASGTKG